MVLRKFFKRKKRFNGKRTRFRRRRFVRRGRLNRVKRFRRRVLKTVRNAGLVKYTGSGVIDQPTAVYNYFAAPFIINTFAQSNNATPWNFCAMDWPNPGIGDGDNNMRGSKAYFKTNVLTLAIDSDLNAANDPMAPYWPAIGYRIIFFRPRDTYVATVVTPGRSQINNPINIGLP